MDSALRDESERLRLTWDTRPGESLDNYLVSGIEDPRINAHSILTRALITDTLFPRQFDSLIDAEFRFGITMTWLVQQRQTGHGRWEILDWLETRDASLVPAYVLDTHEVLKNPEYRLADYLTEALFTAPGEENGLLPDKALDTFGAIWSRVLETGKANGISIIEPACGSANDYRYLSQYGFAPFLRYSGFDISQKNIENARNRFPDKDFFEGNVFDIQADDSAYEYLFVHDLFEHLSPEGLERAMDEVLRVAGKEAWLSFFSLDEISEHQFNPLDDYYINTLSLDRTIQSLSKRARHVEVVDIATLIHAKTGCNDYYNRQAKTLIVEL